MLEARCLYSHPLPSKLPLQYLKSYLLRNIVSDFSHYCWGHTTAIFLPWPFYLDKTSLGEAQMLFYPGPRTPCLLPPANSWGSPWHTKSRESMRTSSCAEGLCKVVTYCCPKSPTRRHRVPKWASKAYFGELRGALFLDNARLWTPHRTMLFTMFSRHLAGCGGSFFMLERDYHPSSAHGANFPLFGDRLGSKSVPNGAHRSSQNLRKVQKVVPRGTQNASKKTP